MSPGTPCLLIFTPSKLEGRQLLITLRGFDVVFHVLTTGRKATVGGCISVLLCATTECPVAQTLLTQLCTDTWLRAFRVMLVNKVSPCETSVKEKVAVLLQKISKLKTAKAMFERAAVRSAVMDALQGQSAESFYAMNLRSVLLNITAPS